MQTGQVHRSRRLVAGLALCVVHTATSRAHATEPAPELTLVLRYQVDSKVEACPSEREFRRSIVDQLAFDPFREGAPQVIVADVRPADAGLAGSVVWTDATGKQEGERQFASPSQSCAELARAMSFSIAVQIQLLNGAESKPATPQPVAQPSQASAPNEPAPRPRPKPAERYRDRYWSLGVGPTVELGAAPSVAAGARIFGGVRSGVLSLELGAFGTLPVRRGLADGSGFSTSLLGLTLVPCAHHGSFALCAIGRLDRLSAHGFNVDEPRSPAALAAQAGLRFGFQRLFSERLLLGAHADSLGRLTQRTVYLNTVPAWSMPSWGLSFGIDVACVFP